jgi:hypothetical protein
MSALDDQAAKQLPHCGQATPGNRRVRLAHAPLQPSTGARHATSPAIPTSLPAGTNGPFQDPTNRVDCPTKPRQIPQV